MKLFKSFVMIAIVFFLAGCKEDISLPTVTIPTSAPTTQPETETTAPTQGETIYDRNDMEEVLQNVQSIKVHYFGTETYQTESPEVIAEIVASFYGWPMKDNATEFLDTGLEYTVSFDDKLTIDFSLSTNYGRINEDQPYMLPQSFLEVMKKYVAGTDMAG